MLDRVKQLLEPDVGISAKLIAISLFFGKLFETQDSRIESLESRQLEKGEKGDRGERGEKGDIGPQGKKGEIGPKGDTGAIGKDGKVGKQGVSVVDAEIAMDDHLVLKLSNGKEIDAGALPTKDIEQILSVSGNAWQVTVSATAPSNPQLNQLWLDIS